MYSVENNRMYHTVNKKSMFFPQGVRQFKLQSSYVSLWSNEKKTARSVVMYYISYIHSTSECLAICCYGNQKFHNFRGFISCLKKLYKIKDYKTAIYCRQLIFYITIISVCSIYKHIPYISPATEVNKLISNSLSLLHSWFLTSLWISFPAKLQNKLH